MLPHASMQEYVFHSLHLSAYTFLLRKLFSPDVNGQHDRMFCKLPCAITECTHDASGHGQTEPAESGHAQSSLHIQAQSLWQTAPLDIIEVGFYECRPITSMLGRAAVAKRTVLRPGGTHKVVAHRMCIVTLIRGTNTKICFSPTLPPRLRTAARRSWIALVCECATEQLHLRYSERRVV